MSHRITLRTAATALAVIAGTVLAGCSSGGSAASGTPGSGSNGQGASGSPAAQPAVTAVPSSPRTTAEGSATQPPWAAPTDPSARAYAAGLPMMGAEGQVMHIHAHLDVLVNGKPVAVPAYIGIDNKAARISPLHTHDTSGVIHIESPVKSAFTLGQFMTEWNVALGADRIGGLEAGGGKALRAYVNGKQIKGDPAAIKLNAHDEIALVYGPVDGNVKVPSTFTFPNGM